MRTLLQSLTLPFRWSLVLGLALGVAAGMINAVMTEAPQSVYAINCQPANDNCTPIGDQTKTSSMTVKHETTALIPAPVEPDDGESFAITATWVSASPCQGNSTVETATVDVSWNGSTWVLSNEVLTNGIVDIDICTVSSCTNGSTTHSWEYRLIVDVEDPHPFSNFNLQKVQYATTAVDDGDELGDAGGSEHDCNEIASVSPTSQTFTGLDSPGKWISARCGFSCSVGGGSMTITYN